MLSSGHILDDNHLVRELDIMKHPHKKETVWLEGAKNKIETKFKVKFPDDKKISSIRLQTIFSIIHSIKG